MSLDANLKRFQEERNDKLVLLATDPALFIKRMPISYDGSCLHDSLATINPLVVNSYRCTYCRILSNLQEINNHPRHTRHTQRVNSDETLDVKCGVLCGKQLCVTHKSPLVLHASYDNNVVALDSWTNNIILTWIITSEYEKTIPLSFNRSESEQTSSPSRSRFASPSSRPAVFRPTPFLPQKKTVSENNLILPIYIAFVCKTNGYTLYSNKTGDKLTQPKYQQLRKFITFTKPFNLGFLLSDISKVNNLHKWDFSNAGLTWKGKRIATVMSPPFNRENTFTTLGEFRFRLKTNIYRPDVRYAFDYSRITGSFQYNYALNFYVLLLIVIIHADNSEGKNIPFDLFLPEQLEVVMERIRLEVDPLVILRDIDMLCDPLSVENNIS